MAREKLLTKPIQFWVSDADYYQIKRRAELSDSDIAKICRSALRDKMKNWPKYD